jgi:hypothetical protein
MLRAGLRLREVRSSALYLTIMQLSRGADCSVEGLKDASRSDNPGTPGFGGKMKPGIGLRPLSLT